jgi:hypothetical protein
MMEGALCRYRHKAHSKTQFLTTAEPSWERDALLYCLSYRRLIEVFEVIQLVILPRSTPRGDERSDHEHRADDERRPSQDPLRRRWRDSATPSPDTAPAPLGSGTCEGDGRD